MIEIVFSHVDFLVIDKPAGLNFHSENGEPGCIALLSEQLNLLDEAAPYSHIYPVHRLDKMTSGLLLVALNKTAAQQFQVMFSERQVHKYYLAVSDQKPKKKQGWVKGDMLSARNGGWKLSKIQENPAITQFLSISLQPKERLFLLKPHTGKTHQLRVMMKSISAPICGDERYAFKPKAAKEDRGYLHAYALQFVWQGKAFDFVQAPKIGKRFLNENCQTQLTQWQTPWDVL